MAFTKITGDPQNVLTPGKQLLATSTASVSATVDFDSGIDWTAYAQFIVEASDVVPDTDNVNFEMRTSTDGGSTYDSGASDYEYGGVQIDSNGGGIVGTLEGNGAAQMVISSNVGSDTGESLALEVKIHKPSGTLYTLLSYHTGYVHTAPICRNVYGAAYRKSAADVDGIRFLFSSGNIESGTFKLYGVA